MAARKRIRRATEHTIISIPRVYNYLLSIFVFYLIIQSFFSARPLCCQNVGCMHLTMQCTLTHTQRSRLRSRRSHESGRPLSGLRCMMLTHVSDARVQHLGLRLHDDNNKYSGFFVFSDCVSFIQIHKEFF